MPRPPVAEVPRRILIVDDERLNRQLLEIMLSQEGCVLVMAENGEDALAIIESDPPDIILLDVSMPGMDGYQVAARVKGNAATKNIPIIMVTALDERNARMDGLNAGAEEFLTKPVDRGELRVRVRNLLRLKAHGDYHDKYSQVLEGEVGMRAADLAESEARFRQLAEAIPQAFFLVDPRLEELFYVSPAFETIYEQPCASFYARPRDWHERIHPDDRARVRSEIMRDGTLIPFDVEYRIVRPSGKQRLVRTHGSPVFDAEGKVWRFAGIIEDITDQRALEGQLRQSKKMDAIGQLAGGVAHDFNNILSVILSYSELCAAELRSGDPMRADIEEIRAAGLRAVELTRQLLTFSRQQVLEPKIVDLSDIVNRMENMLRRLIGEDVELTATCPTGLRRVLVDPGQIEQVVMNLSVNARDAMPRGGKLTIETAAVELDEAYASEHVGVTPGAHIMLAVSDNGTGIDKETQARMFEPFFTTKEVGKGTGLGLATVFGIVRQSAGSIWVYSEPGKGTTFKVYFPVADQTVVERASAMPPRVSDRLHGSETVLLVEDEEHVRVLCRTILRKYGYSVLEAQGGGDAVLVCEQHKAAIHLLLTDVIMPRMSGPELAVRLALVRPEMKVLYMSGYTDDAVVRHGILERTMSFVQKPITPEVLARKVREALDAFPTR